jgi:hypothetical protein
MHQRTVPLRIMFVKILLSYHFVWYRRLSFESRDEGLVTAAVAAAESRIQFLSKVDGFPSE